MRWEIEHKKKVYKRGKGMIPKQPKIGDIKKEIKFAYFPIKITPTEVVWLEKYVKVYEYGEKLEHRVLSIADYGRISWFDFGDKNIKYNTWLFKKLEYYG